MSTMSIKSLNNVNVVNNVNNIDGVSSVNIFYKNNHIKISTILTVPTVLTISKV